MEAIRCATAFPRGQDATTLAQAETVIGLISGYPFTIVGPEQTPQIIVNPVNGTATVTAGNSATFSLNVSAQGTLPTAVTFSCGTLPAETACTFNPASVNATSTPTTVILTITTTAPGMAMSAPANLHQPSLLFAVGLLFPALLVCAPAWTRRRPARERVKRRLALGAMTFLLLLLAACGSDAKTPTGGTPTGTLTVTVTSAAGSVQTKTTLTLNVQ
jgi:hypothetical protein